MSMGGSLPTVGAQVVIQGMAQFALAQRQITNSLNNINHASTNLARGSNAAWMLAASSAKMGAAGIVAASAAVVTGIIGVSAAYQNALQPVIVFGKATVAQGKEVSNTILELSRDFNQSSTAIADAGANLAKAGMGFEQINREGLKAATALVTVSKGELDAGRAAELLTQLTFAYKDSALSATEAANILAGAVLESTGNWQDAYLSFKQIIPLLSQLGVPASEAAAMMALLWQEGIRGETAGTSMRNALLKLINPTKSVEQAMKQYGIALFDASGKSIGLRPVIGQLEAAFGKQAIALGKVTEQEADVALASLGLSRSVLALLTIAQQGTAAFDEFHNKIKQTDIIKSSIALQDTLLEQIGLLINQVKAFTIVFGTGFIKVLTDGATALNLFLRQFQLEPIEKFGNSIVKTIGDAFGSIGATIQSVMGSPIAINFLKILNDRLVAAYAIAQNLSITFMAIWNNPGVRSTLNALLDGFNKLLGVTTSISAGLSEKFLVAIVAISEALRTGVIAALEAIPWTSISTGITKALNDVTYLFEGGAGKLFDSWTNSAIEFANNIPVVLTGAMNNAITVISSTLNDLMRGIEGTVNSLMESAVSLTNSVITSVTDSLNSTFEGLINAAEAVYNTFERIAIDIWSVMRESFVAILRGFQPLLDAFSETLPGAVNVLVEATKIALTIGIVAFKLYEKYNANTTKSTADTTKGVTTYWNAVAPFLTDLWNRIGKSAAEMWDNFIDNVYVVIKGMEEGLRANLTYWIGYWRSVAQGGEMAATFIIEQLSRLFAWLEQQPFIGEYVKGIRVMFEESRTSVDDFFKSIGDMPGSVLDKVKSAYEDVSSGIESTLADVGETLSGTFNAVGDSLTAAFEEAKATVAGMIPDVGGAVANVQAFIERMMAAARNSIGSARPAVDALLKSIREAMSGAGGIKPGAAGAFAPAKPPMSGDASNLGEPLNAADMLAAKVKMLLKDMPGLNAEFTEFITKIAEGDYDRLDPMVAALRSQYGLLREILIAKKALIATEIKLAEVEEVLANLQHQQQVIENARAQAMLPYETRLLELRQQKVALDLKALPIEQQIAAIDRQIGDLQKENLELSRQRLLITQAMLPIQQDIAALDKQIAEAQRENLSVQRQLLVIDQQLLPINQKIEDIQAKITELGREDYALTREKAEVELKLLAFAAETAIFDAQIAELSRVNYELAAKKLNAQISMFDMQQRVLAIDKQISELQRTNYELVAREAQTRYNMLGIQRQIEGVDKKIADAGKVDYDMIQRKLEVQRAMLGGQQKLAEIDKRMAALQRTDFGLALQRAKMDLAALDARNAIVDIEKEISEIVDKRQQLTMRRDELIAQRNLNLTERQLETVNKQLEDLWQEFNFKSQHGDAAGAGLIIAGIIDLEGQRAILERALKPLEESLENIKEQQEDINITNELATIALQLQQQVHESILKPIQDKIDLLEREQLIARIKNAEVLAQLESERQAIVEQLQPHQDILDAMEARNELTEINTAITVNGLQRIRAELLRQLQPYQDIIDGIVNVREETELKNAVTIAGLNREKDLILSQINDYQGVIDEIDRRNAKTALYNELTILGLEQQKQKLADLAEPFRAQLAALVAQQESTALLNTITKTRYEEEIQKLKDIAKPLEDKRLAIVREQDAAKIRADLIVNGLEAEKVRLAGILKPLQDKLDAIDDENAALTIQKALIINSLDTQKSKLEGMLKPIDDARLKIEDQTKALELQKLSVAGVYDLAILRLSQLVLPQEGYRLKLLEIAKAENDRLVALIGKFQESIVKSGAFSAAEAIESSKRLALWGPEVSKVSDLKDQYAFLVTATGPLGSHFQTIADKAGPAASALNNMKTPVSDLAPKLNDIAGAVGAHGTGLSGNMAGLTTALGNVDARTGAVYGLNMLSDRAGAARTAIGDSGNGLYKATADLKNMINDTAGTDYLKGLWGVRTRIENVFGPEATTAWNTNIGIVKEAFLRLKEAINGAADAQGRMTTATTKYFATQAVANAIAIATYNTFRGMGYSYDQSASTAYQTVKDRITNGSIGYAEGGIVPGPINAPMSAIVHGGERIIPTSAGIGSMEPTRAIAAQQTQYNIVNNYNYNLTGNYERYQDPVTIDQNLRTIVEMSRR